MNGVRSLILLPVLMAMALIVLVPSSSAEDDPSEDSDAGIAFDVDGVTYYVEDGEAYVSSYYDDDPVKDLVIPESVEHLGKTYPVVGLYMLSIMADGLETVTLPSTIVDYNIGAVSSSTVTAINIDSPRYVSVDGAVYTKDKSVLIQYPRGKADAVFNVEPDVKIVEDSAVSSNEHLVTLNLPSTVYCINNAAFYGCTALEHVNSQAPDSLPEMLVIVGDSAFDECPKLKSLALPFKLKSIGEYAFASTGLETVDIPYSVATLGVGAFSNCTSLKAFTSSNSVFMEDGGVLYECRENYKAVACYPAGRDGESFIIPSDVVSISHMAFRGCVNLKHVELPAKMTEVPELAFTDCTSLETVKFPDSIVSIGMLAFQGCSNLRDVVIPARVGVLGVNAFSGTAITSVTVPASVYYMEYGVFSNCKSLKSVLVEEGSLEMETMVFFGCLALETVEFAGTDVTFGESSLSAGTEDNKVTLRVIVPKGLSVPSTAADQNTTLNVEVKGERPYPYENFIGVAICIAVILLIVYAVREV